jgi:small-conductance mechanosensitive channel
MAEWLGLSELAQPVQLLISRAISTLVIIVVLMLFSGIIRSQIRRRLRNSPNARMLVLLARNLVILFGGLAIVFIWLGAGGDFAVALGIIGAGVAFASQEIIGSFAGYLIIISGNLFRIGDRVRIGEIVGDVIDLNLMRTTMMEIGAWVDADQYSGRLVTVSNRSALNTPIYNFTKYNPYIWDEIVLPIPYSDNWRRAIEIVLAEGERHSSEFQQQAKVAFDALARRYPISETEVKPTVFLRMTDNWIEVTLRYVVDTRRRRPVQVDLYRDIIEIFEATPDVNVASTTIDIVGMPPLPRN